ncbi:unnamed protein product [Phaeothamnion confervicola]
MQRTMMPLRTMAAVAARARTGASVAPCLALRALRGTAPPSEPSYGTRVRRLSSAAAVVEEDHADDASADHAPRRRRLRERPPSIQLTDRAAERIRELMAQCPSAAGVRLGVRRRGCNGFSYTLKFSDDKPAKDEEIADKGVRVFVDPSATFYVVGTVMDWEETELSAEFTFTNPNAKGTCGCGESFNV